MRAWAWWVCVVGAAAGARELDPAACAPRFDVQRDKIIRTEESRDMGARYLSELDVGARHECLRLCCETDACDVFVYEEKSPGSCYLFKCGPPEDFRCKFTAHGNFSSGVLALGRRRAELQDRDRHEHDLASLRVTSTTSSSTTTPPPPAPPREHHQLLPTGRCSRFQFECRRGGECIAVYNACDGVPQCADGSDEAPELGCPPPAPAPLATPAARATPAPRPQAQRPAEALEGGREGGGGAGSQLELEAAAARERWPHRLAQAQPQHRYDEAPSSHIFSHKGGLLQEPEPAQFAPFERPAPYEPAAPFEPPAPFDPPPAPAAWPRRAWPHQPGMESMSPERGWGGAGAGAGVGTGVGAGGGYSRLEWPEPDPRRAWPVPQPRPEPEMPVYIPAKTMPELPMVYSSQQQTLRDSPKKGFELNKPEPEPEPEPEPTAAPPPAPAPNPTPARRQDPAPSTDNRTNNKDSKDKTAESETAVAHPEPPAAVAPAPRPLAAVAPGATGGTDPRAGLSEHPPAAVLLLVLGVVMTTVLGALAACRLRAARRRLRRGKSPFAHDADYLVNGMYL